MRLTSPSFRDGDTIPASNAFAVPDADQHIRFSENRNPALSWEDVPDGTRSFALLCIDRDAPSAPDDVNQEGRTVPSDLPRVDFSHWVLVDIPPETRSIEEGSYADAGVVPHGKQGRATGPREGINDYTSWFAGDPDMEGVYKGYDGPCPPWNDSIPHRYEFTIYALDLDRVPVEGDFSAADVLAAIDGHVLAEASVAGIYSLNPGVT
ncbi:MAG: YbhB/YbcL family Raf kinase inhibitor-like protein [Actinomycetota bacterium]